MTAKNIAHIGCCVWFVRVCIHVVYTTNISSSTPLLCFIQEYGLCTTSSPIFGASSQVVNYIVVVTLTFMSLMILTMISYKPGMPAAFCGCVKELYLVSIHG